jgi:hypothetical protein
MDTRAFSISAGAVIPYSTHHLLILQTIDGKELNVPAYLPTSTARTAVYGNKRCTEPGAPNQSEVTTVSTSVTAPSASESQSALAVTHPLPTEAMISARLIHPVQYSSPSTTTTCAAYPADISAEFKLVLCLSVLKELHKFPPPMHYPQHVLAFF